MDSSPLPAALPSSPCATLDPAAPFVLTQADIREFRKLIEEHCGVSLTEPEAWNRATELVALYRMFLGPFPEDPAIPAQP